VIKAWSASLYGRPPVLDEHVHAEIEVICDAWRRPAIRVHRRVAEHTAGASFHISLSHDADYATAYAVMTSGPSPTSATHSRPSVRRLRGSVGVSRPPVIFLCSVACHAGPLAGSEAGLRRERRLVLSLPHRRWPAPPRTAAGRYTATSASPFPAS